MKSLHHCRNDTPLPTSEPSSRSPSKADLVKKGWGPRLHEKNAKLNEMPCHPRSKNISTLTSKSAAFQTTTRGLCSAPRSAKATSRLSPSGVDVSRTVRRGAADAGIETAVGCCIFRATGITDYLTNGGRIEAAQRAARHSNMKTTGLYDRCNDDIRVGEVGRIGI
jgi:integrase/recombinase XerD